MLHKLMEVVDVTDTQPIVPYGNNYLVTHMDLVKFGIDDTKKMKPAVANLSHGSGVNPLPSPGDEASQIEIQTTLLISDGTHNGSKAVVEQDTGLITRILRQDVLSTSSIFDTIIRFEPETFPDTTFNISIHEVEFWVKSKTKVDYISPR